MFHASSETRKSGGGLCLCKSLECATGKSEENVKQRIKNEQRYNYQEILTLEDGYRLFSRIFVFNNLTCDCSRECLYTTDANSEDILQQDRYLRCDNTIKIRENNI